MENNKLNFLEENEKCVEKLKKAKKSQSKKIKLVNSINNFVGKIAEQLIKFLPISLSGCLLGFVLFLISSHFPLIIAAVLILIFNGVGILTGVISNLRTIVKMINLENELEFIDDTIILRNTLNNYLKKYNLQDLKIIREKMKNLNKGNVVRNFKPYLDCTLIKIIDLICTLNDSPETIKDEEMESFKLQNLQIEQFFLSSHKEIEHKFIKRLKKNNTI